MTTLRDLSPTAQRAVAASLDVLRAEARVATAELELNRLRLVELEFRTQVPTDEVGAYVSALSVAWEEDLLNRG